MVGLSLKTRAVFDAPSRHHMTRTPCVMFQRSCGGKGSGSCHCDESSFLSQQCSSGLRFLFVNRMPHSRKITRRLTPYSSREVAQPRTVFRSTSVHPGVGQCLYWPEQSRLTAYDPPLAKALQ